MKFDNCIIRRIDNLGRVVIPKEMRNYLRIKNGDFLDIGLYDNSIILEKHLFFSDKYTSIIDYISSMDLVLKKKILVVSFDEIIACSECIKKDYSGKKISSFLSDLICGRKRIVENGFSKINFIDNVLENSCFVLLPVLLHGDLYGAIVIFSNDELINEVDCSFAFAFANFLLKYIE